MTIINDPNGSFGPVNSVDPSAQLALQELEGSLQVMTGPDVLNNTSVFAKALLGKSLPVMVCDVSTVGRNVA